MKLKDHPAKLTPKACCAKCHSPILFSGQKWRLDECGFKTYSMKCKCCGTSLSVLVDPFDGMPLVSEVN
jgi:hypothetical protein